MGMSDIFKAERSKYDEEFDAHAREVIKLDDIPSDVFFSAVARRYLRDNKFAGELNSFHWASVELYAKIDDQRRKLKVKVLEVA